MYTNAQDSTNTTMVLLMIDLYMCILLVLVSLKYLMLVFGHSYMGIREFSQHLLGSREALFMSMHSIYGISSVI
jgi:hypothetical protein